MTLKLTDRVESWLLIGIPVLRLSGHYLAMATLGFNFVVHTVFLEWDAVTGGPSGFSGIPYLGFGEFYFDTEIRLHYLLWGFTIICLMICLNLVRSSVGRGLAALAGDETAAAALGVNTRTAKIKVFVLSAVLASVGGSRWPPGYRTNKRPAAWHRPARPEAGHCPGSRRPRHGSRSPSRCIAAGS